MMDTGSGNSCTKSLPGPDAIAISIRMGPLFRGRRSRRAVKFPNVHTEPLICIYVG